MMSSTVSTSRAPSRIKRWQPRLERLSAGPGTAKTSRFCSMAWRAVESDPLRGVASTTTTPERDPRDDPVPLGEEPGQRNLPHRHLAHERAGHGQGASELLVFRRIDRRQPVGQHGDRSAPRGDRTSVGRGVDAPGQARDDREARSGQRRRPAARPSALRKACSAASRPGRSPARPWPRSFLSCKAGRADRGCSRAQPGYSAVASRRRCSRRAAGKAPARRSRVELERGPGRSSGRAWDRHHCTAESSARLAESTRPAEPNRSSSTRQVCGPTPGTDVRWIKSSSRSSASESAQVTLPFQNNAAPVRRGRPCWLKGLSRSMARTSSSPAASVNSTFPIERGKTKRMLPEAILLVAAHGVLQLRSRSSPGRSTGSPNRSSNWTWRSTTSRDDPSQPLGQPALGDHPHRDRFAVPERPVVAGDGLDRMRDRVAEIEHGPFSPFLPLVAGDHARLDPAALQDDLLECAASSAPRISAGISARGTRRSGSLAITPYLTTSASPQRNSRSGRVSSVCGVDPDAARAGRTRRSGSWRGDG